MHTKRRSHTKYGSLCCMVCNCPLFSSPEPLLIAQGRDTTSAAQYPGALEPYSFPMAPGPTQGEQERWRNVEKWIWLFYKKLRCAVCLHLHSTSATGM